MYDCTKEGAKWGGDASCISQGWREPVDWDVPKFLIDHSFKIEIDRELTISLFARGHRVRTISAEENPLVYFPANTTLAKSIPLRGLATEDSDGRYALDCSPDLKSFTLRGHATLTFERKGGRSGQ